MSSCGTWPGDTHRVSITWLDEEARNGGYTWTSGRTISANGRRIAFHSYSNDMTPGSGGQLLQVYVRERG
jgi:hypothetical protein